MGFDPITVRKNAESGTLVVDICLFGKELLAVERAIETQQRWKDACFRSCGKTFPAAAAVPVLYSDVAMAPEVLLCASLTGVFFNQGRHTCICACDCV